MFLYKWNSDSNTATEDEGPIEIQENEDVKKDINFLRTYLPNHPKELEMTDRAENLWMNYKRTKGQQATLFVGNGAGTADLKSLYKEMLLPNTLKMAGLSAICNWGRLYFEPGKIILIEDDDLKWAIGRTEKYIREYLKPMYPVIKDSENDGLSKLFG